MRLSEDGLQVRAAHCSARYDDIAARLSGRIDEGGGFGFLFFSGLFSRHRLVGEVGAHRFRLTPAHKMGGASVSMIGEAVDDGTSVRSVITWPAIIFFWGMPTGILLWMVPWYWACIGSLVFGAWGLFQAKMASSIGLRFLSEEVGMNVDGS
jgi:hypothetical protein